MRHRTKEIIHKYRYDDIAREPTIEPSSIKIEIRAYDKNKNQVDISNPDGEPYFFIDIGCFHPYGHILTNSPEYYFLADQDGNFKKITEKIKYDENDLVFRQDFGSGDKVIINSALRKFRKTLRRSRVEVVGNEAKTKAENET